MEDKRIVLSVVGVSVGLYLLCRKVIENVGKIDNGVLGVKPVNFTHDEVKDLGSAVGVPRIPVKPVKPVKPVHHVKPVKNLLDNTVLVDYAPPGGNIHIDLQDNASDLNGLYNEELSNHNIDVVSGGLPTFHPKPIKPVMSGGSYSVPPGGFPHGFVVKPDVIDTPVIGLESEYNDFIKPIGK